MRGVMQELQAAGVGGLAGTDNVGQLIGMYCTTPSPASVAGRCEQKAVFQEFYPRVSIIYHLPTTSPSHTHGISRRLEPGRGIPHLTMPEAQAAQGQQAQPARGPMLSPFTKLILGAAAYFGLNFAMNQMLAGPKQTGTMVLNEATGEMINVPSNMDDIPPYQLRPKQLKEGAKYQSIPKRVAPIWPMDSYVDIVITLSDSFQPTSLSSVPNEYLLMDEKHYKMGNYSDKRTIETTFAVPETVQNNGTLWGHFYVGLEDSVLDPRDPKYDIETAYHFAWPLTQYIPKKPERKAHNLLEGKAEEEEDEEIEEPTGPIIANYYHSNSTLSFIPDAGVLDFQQIHPAIRQFLRLEPQGFRDGSGKNGWYYPILFVNSFWQLKSHMTLLNDTVTELPLRIDLGNLAYWKFNMMAAIELSGQQASRAAAFGESTPGGGDGSEIELIKEIFLDTNPILLAITGIVSVAHIILEMLAFGSDIAHYRKKKDNVGISVRTILVNAFMQTVIFLYLVDNAQNTSWIILGGQGVGILIELWKITTIVNVRLRPSDPGAWLPYQIIFEDKHKLSETEEKTKEYDSIAFNYMYIAGVPLLIGYAIYSLVYDSHKSWYSYVLTTLVGSVYAYGFLMMVPSLYINYRLKSIAHMPGKAMMYKFLNTFIDDLFAFTIKMPLLHRLATFRDDVIFFVYIYQRWAYKVDYTRVNEFGQGGEEEDVPAAVEEKKEDEKAVEVEKEKEKEKETSAKASGADSGSVTKRK
ncbi:cleft lip and palate transmembrane 1 (CLPTM1) [Zalerion maritima]|uniref:Cleft lip and palate transmembrane 1 (CLPTM1) n=1 Tax=Zalerion maritima TaxID=339359 RepID=A0AAD5RWQ2_9PEZI|nr:cleft lip and palate transmembrane 1 (CLPTM1) [Zalerion maritima]